MQKVYVHENLAMVSSAKNLLEQAGIESVIKNEYHAGGGHPGLAAIPIELWVEDDAVADGASSLIRETFAKHDNEPDWTCAHCGEVNAASFETCWQCQRPRSESAGS